MFSVIAESSISKEGKWEIITKHRLPLLQSDGQIAPVGRPFLGNCHFLGRRDGLCCRWAQLVALFLCILFQWWWGDNVRLWFSNVTLFENGKGVDIKGKLLRKWQCQLFKTSTQKVEAVSFILQKVLKILWGYFFLTHTLFRTRVKWKLLHLQPASCGHLRNYNIWCLGNRSWRLS